MLTLPVLLLAAALTRVSAKATYRCLALVPLLSAVLLGLFPFIGRGPVPPLEARLFASLGFLLSVVITVLVWRGRTVGLVVLGLLLMGSAYTTLTDFAVWTQLADIVSLAVFIWVVYRLKKEPGEGEPSLAA